MMKDEDIIESEEPVIDIEKRLNIILEKPYLGLDEQDCINKYSTVPWLPDINVDKIYINTENERLKNILNKRDNFIEYENKEWFEIGKILLVQCVKNRIKR